MKNGWKPITPPSVTLVLDQYAPPGAIDPVVFKNLEPPCKSTDRGREEGPGLGCERWPGVAWAAGGLESDSGRGLTGR